MQSAKCKVQNYKGDNMKSWTDLMEEATELTKKNAGLMADRFRIYRLAVSVLNNLEKITPIEPGEYRMDSATDDAMKIVNICMPQN